MAQIENRFNRLLAQVEIETGNRPTHEEFAESIGVARATITRFAGGKTGRYDGELLMKIVDRFDELLENGCTLADLIAYPPVPSQETNRVVALAA